MNLKNTFSGIVLGILCCATLFSGCLHQQESHGKSSEQPMSEQIDNYLQFTTGMALPTTLEFCGEKFPISDPEIRERAERELLLLLQQPGQIALYMRRSARYFPLYEKILAERNMPKDLKYLSVAESALFMSRSAKDAVGLWQFIPETARAHGLQVDEYIDERRHPEKSTRAALEYLGNGYRSYSSWIMAAAGFNMGYSGLQNDVKFQGKTSYFDLYLNEETSRYVFRIAAIKEIFEHPERYGISSVPQLDYTPPTTKSVVVQGAIADLAEWAKTHGTTYKNVKVLNPWIMKRSLPAPKSGRYVIEIPV